MRDMTAFGCVNNTIRVRSGRYFDLADPKPDQFKFSDVAGALAKICRFGGQCDRFYSVAEHCYHCAEQARIDKLPLETQRAVLLHDAAEAFIGDMVKPLKVMMPDYGAVEHRIEEAIAAKYGVDFAAETLAVRKIDREMLIAERRALFSADRVLWTGEDEVRALKLDFGCWPCAQAEILFTQLAMHIGVDTTA